GVLRAGVGRAAPGQQGQGREGRRQGGQDAFAMVHSTSVRGHPPRKMSGRPPFASRPPRNCNLTANYYTHRAVGCQYPAEGFFLRCGGRLPSLFTLRLAVALSVYAAPGGCPLCLRCAWRLPSLFTLRLAVALS